MYDPYLLSHTACESVTRPQQVCSPAQGTYWQEEYVCAAGVTLKLFTHYSYVTELPTGHVLFRNLKGEAVAAPSSFTVGDCQAATVIAPAANTGNNSGLRQELAFAALTTQLFRHNLGLAPNIRVLDSTGRVVNVSVEHIYEPGSTLTNEVRISTNQAFNGLLIIQS